MMRAAVIGLLAALVLATGWMVFFRVKEPAMEFVPPSPVSPLAPAQPETQKAPAPDPVVTSTPERNPPVPPPPPTTEGRKGSVVDGVWIEDGTPEALRVSGIQGYKPAKIFADGTQIFENMPAKVRNAQGQLEERRVTITRQTAKPVPVDPVELPK